MADGYDMLHGAGVPPEMMAVGNAAMPGVTFAEQHEFAPELHHSNEIVRINVSGKRYMTLYDTLANGQSRFFEHMFAVDRLTGKVIVYRQNIIEDEDGQIFINRDGKLFAYVLQYMRDGNRTVLPESTFLIRQLIREAEFFAMERYKALLLKRLNEEEEEKSRRPQNDVTDKFKRNIPLPNQPFKIN